MRSVSTISTILAAALVLGCGYPVNTTPASKPSSAEAQGQAVSNPPAKAPKIIQGRQRYGSDGPCVDVGEVWEMYDTDIVQFEQTYKDNIIETNLVCDVSENGVHKDSGGYYILKGDYNARRSIHVYLREPDAKRLSTLYRDLAGQPNSAKEFGKYRIRVRVEANPTLSFVDGYLVDRK